jgi:hypothetical protein
MRILLALSSQDIRVLSFARFDDTLSVVEKASELTHATTSTNRTKSVVFVRFRIS